MTKLNILQLRKAIGREEFDHHLLVAALSSYQAVDQKINELLKSGTIIRVKKGLYTFGEDARQAPISKEYLANLIYGPSCISMEYALFHHGLIPAGVQATVTSAEGVQTTVTSVTPKRDKEFNTPVGRFTYRYLSESKYPHGIEGQLSDQQNAIVIATPEKALCDLVSLTDIPTLTTGKAAKDFLALDLQMDEAARQRFDFRRLISLNQYYKNESITHIIEALC